MALKAVFALSNVRVRDVGSVTKSDITSALGDLGLGPGMDLMVHSSLRSFGRVEGGACAVIEALMEVLTPAWTLVMPSFNHGAAFSEDGPGHFDPTETPTTNGVIPETFWRMAGVCRSLNPTHSFAAWGRNALKFTELHHRTLTMGPCSPLGLLQAEGGFCLLMGVGYGVNTFHHVVEMSIGAPCLGRRTAAYPMILPNGRLVEGRSWGFREKPCPHTDKGAYGPIMARNGLQWENRVGESRLILFRLEDCYNVVSALLRDGVDDRPPCRLCPIRPRRTAWTVTSDWDEERQCLLPDSSARLY